MFLKDYFKVFPRNQVLVQRLEDRSANLTAAMREIFRFLDMGILLIIICIAKDSTQRAPDVQITSY